MTKHFCDTCLEEITPGIDTYDITVFDARYIICKNCKKEIDRFVNNKILEARGFKKKEDK